MKISRRRKYNKRSKYTKRFKYTRHTKRGGGKHYKNKRTYRKHPRKLKHKSRLQRGGVIQRYNDWMEVDTITHANGNNSNLYIFRDKKENYTVFDSSDEHEGQANYVLELTYTKDRRGDTFIPPFFKSKTKEFPNKRFDWRITLISIDEIQEGTNLRYRYTYKIQLCCRLKDGRYITFNTGAYADTIDNKQIRHNTITSEIWTNSSIHVVNEHAFSGGKRLSEGMILTGTISRTCYDNVDVSSIGDNTRVYTFPIAQNSITFQKIVNIFHDLKRKADVHVLEKLGISDFATRSMPKAVIPNRVIKIIGPDGIPYYVDTWKHKPPTYDPVLLELNNDNLSIPSSSRQ